MTMRLNTLQRDLRYAAEAMCKKAWRDAMRPTEEANDILHPGWRDDLRREVEKRAFVMPRLEITRVSECAVDTSGGIG